MTEVYVSSVLGPRTGGPEAVHQLVHSLRSRDIPTFIVPMRGSRGKQAHSDYNIYDFEVVDAIPRTRDHRLVVTEVSPLESWKEIRVTNPSHTWLWWLSVNNAPDQRARYYSGQDKRSRVQGMWKEAVGRGKVQDSVLAQLRAFVTEMVSLSYSQSLLSRNIQHLAQSYYAVDFCESQLGQPATLVSDYLRDLPPMSSGAVRRNLVTYNGSRGYSLIGQLERALPELEFVPISGMNYSEVCEILAESAAYIELGHLPGRDRLPREAGRLGTPVVLLERGAGTNVKDFPLPDLYRIPLTEDWATHFTPVLAQVVSDRQGAQVDQQGYREWVLTDRSRFESEIDNWVPLLLQ